MARGPEEAGEWEERGSKRLGKGQKHISEMGSFIFPLTKWEV